VETVVNNMTAGSVGDAQSPHRQSMLARFSKSIRVQLAVLLLIFSIPPILLYSVFGAAEREKQQVLLEAVRENGRIVARGLTPFIQAMQPGDVSRIPQELARFESDQRSIKVLFKPAEGRAGFYYVASTPSVPAEDLAEERERLVDLGIIAQLDQSCSGDVALGHRVTSARRGEYLLSITPLQSARGCWVIIVAADESAVAGLSDERAYWQRPEARVAALVYAIMAVMVFVVFASVWSALARFKRTAATIERGSSFASATAVPELKQMGRVFDAMVERLRQATELLRRAAEDNAHAFKAPIAVIRQASALVAGRARDSDVLAVTAINTSLDRLEGLVRSARHLDAATADLLDPQWTYIDLSRLAADFVSDYALTLETRAVRVIADVAPGIAVNGREELLETIFENLLDNAIGFSPEGGNVTVRLRGENEFAVLSVVDEGPGVGAGNLPHIFDRYFSARGEQHSAATDTSTEPHFGIGLWLVRQNAYALGGSAEAANNPSGGFTVTVRLPLA
jgi:two-component system sensor histidine kinase ChvG